jgi:hypothetical protein
MLKIEARPEMVGPGRVIQDIQETQVWFQSGHERVSSGEREAVPIGPVEYGEMKAYVFRPPLNYRRVYRQYAAELSGRLPATLLKAGATGGSGAA